MLRRGTLLGILFSLPLIAVPEIEKVGQVCEKGVCLAWWPKLEPATGWHHERGPSLQNGVNVQIPDGFTFSNAETVIYAKAAYKPRIPKTTSLEAFIKNDTDEFRKDDPSIAITEVTPLKTKDGKAFESYTFFPKAKGQRQLGRSFVRRGRGVLLDLYDQFQKPCGIPGLASGFRAIHSAIQRVTVEIC